MAINLIVFSWIVFNYFLLNTTKNPRGKPQIFICNFFFIYFSLKFYKRISSAISQDNEKIKQMKIIINKQNCCNSDYLSLSAGVFTIIRVVQIKFSIFLHQAFYMGVHTRCYMLEGSLIPDIKCFIK